MNKNNFILGVGIGLVAPLIAYILHSFYRELFLTWNKEMLVYVIAALVNLISLRFYYRKGCVETGKGIIMVTFIAAMALFLLTNISLI